MESRTAERTESEVCLACVDDLGSPCCARRDVRCVLDLAELGELVGRTGLVVPSGILINEKIST
jgi:hypothetical protein